MSKPSLRQRSCRRRLARFVFSRLNSLEKQIRGTYVASHPLLISMTRTTTTTLGFTFYSCRSSAAREFRTDETGRDFAGELKNAIPQEATLVSERLSGSNKYRRS
jgi:hypothetical protein